MTLTSVTYDPMLKDIFAPGPVENIGFKNNPIYGLMKKTRGKTVGGRFWTQPVGTRLVNQGSTRFDVANAATTNESKYDAFQVPRSKHYRIARIENEVLEATADNMDAFQPAIDEIKRCMEAEANWINFRLSRGRGGYIGRMTNTSFATAVMTVDDPAALWAVSAGDVLQLAITDGTTGTVKAGTVTVLSVQHPSPGGVATITLTGNISAGIATAAANDFIFLNGDFGNDPLGGFSPAGFADYITDTAAAAATTLFGFDRSVDSRLGGGRVDGTSSTISDLIIEMMAMQNSIAGQYATGKRVIFAHPFTLANLQKQLDGKWVVMQSASFNEKSKTAAIGYNTFEINQLGVVCNIVPDPMHPVNRINMVDLDSWTLFHAGMFPAFLTEKYGEILKPAENSDGWECRVGGYCNSVTKSPHCNVVGLVA